VLSVCGLQDGRTALHHAVLLQSAPTVVRRLIQLGADVNIKDHVSTQARPLKPKALSAGLMSVRPSVCPSISQQHRRARRRPASHSTRRRRQHQRSRESVRSAHPASTSSPLLSAFTSLRSFVSISAPCRDQPTLRSPEPDGDAENVARKPGSGISDVSCC